MEITQVKPGYKSTELGVVPEDWEVIKLDNLVNFNNGKAHESDIQDFGKYVVVNSKFISTEGDVKKYSNECHCPTYKDNLLMVMSDIPNGKAIAKCFLVEENGKYTVNQRICSLEVNNCEPKYLFYQLNRNKYYLQFDDGVKQTNLRKDEVLACPILVPSDANEQKAIAAALSDVDALITAQDALVAKKRDIKTATMQQLLAGKVRLGAFDQQAEASGGQSESLVFGDLFEKGSKKSTLNQSEFTFIGMEDVSEMGGINRFNVLPVKLVKNGLTYFEKNDVIVAKITPCFENGKGASLHDLPTSFGLVHHQVNFFGNNARVFALHLLS